MIWIGNHVSVSQGYAAMGAHEIELGGNTLAYFPRNPRGGKSRTPDPKDVEAFVALMREHDFGPLVVHGAYTMNLCAAKPHIRTNSYEMLRDDLVKIQALKGCFYNFHPGCHVGQGVETGIELVAEGLAKAIEDAQEVLGESLQTTVLLETMAGKGTEVGAHFEELRAIIDIAEAKLGNAVELGACFDTCHTWDAGYDNVGNLDGVLKELDSVVGLKRLHAVHLNDSKNPRGSHKDRHARLGEGCLGLDALRAIVTHPLLQDLPFILETPNDDAGYREEIALVRTWIA